MYQYILRNGDASQKISFYLQFVNPGETKLLVQKHFMLKFRISGGLPYRDNA